jgi:hypothetical protein
MKRNKKKEEILIRFLSCGMRINPKSRPANTKKKSRERGKRRGEEIVGLI